ncbi:unnamed protein product [Symbiodinium necroappetens]|uniref:Uncharacterized protein n=1 Tax=Symbiodinium necroappetens TaxID=1628268 RepID=A0A812SQT0_9DINO|nr:unnamed protein product [Symbiodinium necroappetens]
MTNELVRLVQAFNVEHAFSRCFPRLGRGDCLRGVLLVPLRLHSLSVLCQQVARLKLPEHLPSRADGRCSEAVLALCLAPAILLNLRGCPCGHADLAVPSVAASAP